MWLEVFESNQGDLPEDPSCLAGLASLEVLAVPRERESEFSQCCILTYTIQNSSYHTVTSNHQVIKTPLCVSTDRLHSSCMAQKGDFISR